MVYRRFVATNWVDMQYADSLHMLLTAFDISYLAFGVTDAHAKHENTMLLLNVSLSPDLRLRLLFITYGITLICPALN